MKLMSWLGSISFSTLNPRTCRAIWMRFMISRVFCSPRAFCSISLAYSIPPVVMYSWARIMWKNSSITVRTIEESTRGNVAISLDSCSISSSASSL